MAKHNSIVKNLENISKSINSLLEQNLNKLKSDNLKKVVSNNKIVLTFVALFFLFISYILAPIFYNQNDISNVLKSELLSKLNLNFTFNQNLKYNFFPRPHFVSNKSFIFKNQKKISEIGQIKIYISLDNFFSTKNIKINEVILERANFELNSKNYFFFTKILDNNFLNNNLEIRKSNVFFRNEVNEVLFINQIKKLKYYYNVNELRNILDSENEIFNIPYSLKVINYKDENKLLTELFLNNAKLKIENIYNYAGDIKSGSATVLLNRMKSKVDYKTDKNYFEFDFYDDLDEPKYLYNGKLNLKPFYSSFKGNADVINTSYFFGLNAIIPELIKTQIFNNKNIEFKLSLNANKISNNKNFTNFFLKSKIQDGLIDIDETKIEWKNSTIAKLTDTLLHIKEGKLVLDGRSQINITNIKSIYQYFITPKNFRKNIEKIDFNFSYIFGEKTLKLNDIMINGKYNQKVNEKLNNIYIRDEDLQNKIYFKNLINEAIKSYVG